MKIFSFLRAVKIDFVDSKKLRLALLSLMFIIYILIFTSISFLQFDSFSYQDMDLTAVVQNFHSNIRLRFFPVCYGDFSIFSAGHLPLFTILLSPIYALFPFTQTILFLQTLFLGAGIFAVYLIAQELLQPRWALYFAFAYLLYPALNYVNLFEAHFIAFSVPLLFFMFYFFLKKKFPPFLLFMLLSLSCQEDVGLVMMGFGVYALLFSLRRRDRSGFVWGGIPFFFGFAWIIFVLSLSLFIQHNAISYKGLEATANVINTTYLVFYGWLGHTPGETLVTLLGKPFYVMGNIFAVYKIRYLLGLFIPLAFLPFLYVPGLLIVFFGMIESLLSLSPRHSSIYFQYSSMIIPFIFVSAIFGVRQLMRLPYARSRSKAVVLFLACVSLLSAIFIGPFGKLPEQVAIMQLLKESDYCLVRGYLLKQIPKGEPVITTFALSSHLVGRDLLGLFHVFVFEPLQKFIPQVEKRYKYALIDFSDFLTFSAHFNNTPGTLESKCFIFQDGWGLVETVNSVAVFKKGYRSAYRLIDRQGFITSSESGKIDLKSDAAALEYTYARGLAGELPVLELTARVTKTRTTQREYMPCVEIANKEGRLIKKFLVAPVRIYPFRNWQVYEGIVIRSKIYLPKEFNNDDIRVTFLFVPIT